MKKNMNITEVKIWEFVYGNNMFLSKTSRGKQREKWLPHGCAHETCTIE